MPSDNPRKRLPVPPPVNMAATFTGPAGAVRIGPPTVMSDLIGRQSGRQANPTIAAMQAATKDHPAEKPPAKPLALTMPDKEAIERFIREADANAATVLAVHVTDAATHKFAVDALEYCAKAAETLEAERKKATDPINAGLKVIRSWFTPTEKALETGGAHLRAEIAGYSESIATANLAALQTGAVMLPRPEDPRVRIVDDFTIEIVDAAAVPRELCTPDEKKIKAAAKAGISNIPGVRITKSVTTHRVGRIVPGAG